MSDARHDLRGTIAFTYECSHCHYKKFESISADKVKYDYNPKRYAYVKLLCYHCGEQVIVKI